MLTLTPERRAELVDRLESVVLEFAVDEESDETEPFGRLDSMHLSGQPDCAVAE